MCCCPAGGVVLSVSARVSGVDRTAHRLTRLRRRLCVGVCVGWLPGLLWRPGCARTVEVLGRRRLASCPRVLHGAVSGRVWCVV